MRSEKAKAVRFSARPLIVLLLGLVLLAGCDSAGLDECTSERDCPDTSEFFYADWGPGDRLAVIYTPRDSTGQQLYELSGLYLMNLDGSNLRPLVLEVEVGSRINEPEWSPDGGWIAFEAGQIYKVAAGGGTPVQLTFSERGKHQPTWSPDGQWIAFQVWQGWRANRGLWAVRANGTGEHQLPKPPEEQMCLGCTPPPPGHTSDGSDPSWEVRGPDWSPSGNEIAYVTFEAGLGNVHLAVYDSVAAQVDFVYQYETSLYKPRFSPDGARIAFSTAGGGDHGPRLGVISRTGGAPRWLEENVEHPSWSPDGRRLLYRELYHATPGTGDLWIMDADGSDKRQITFSTGHAR